MHVIKHVVDVTTDTNGSAEAYTKEPLNGPVLKIIYTKPDANSFAAGVDFEITTEETGQELWKEDNVDASKTVSPVEKRQDTSGADVTFDGTNAIYGPIYAAYERVKIAISNGGSEKKGQFVILEG